jgi:S-(hydroxymethyl)glutathione dehydrogenase/alcohol dehydrogenase
MSFRPVMVRYGRVIKGSYFGGVKGRSQLPRMVDWYMDGKLVVDDLITHTLPLERINDAFELMQRGQAIRSVVTF